MADFFGGINIAQGGAVAILGVVFLLVMLGRLVPRRTVEDLRADRDARLGEVSRERDTWREAHRESEEARHLLQAQVGELLELSRTAGHVLAALPAPQGVTTSASLAQLPTPQP